MYTVQTNLRIDVKILFTLMFETYSQEGEGGIPSIQKEKN